MCIFDLKKMKITSGNKKKLLNKLRNTRRYRSWKWRDLCTLFRNIALPCWSMDKLTKKLPRINPVDIYEMVNTLEKIYPGLISVPDGVPPVIWDFSELDRRCDIYVHHRNVFNFQCLIDAYCEVALECYNDIPICLNGPFLFRNIISWLRNVIKIIIICNRFKTSLSDIETKSLTYGKYLNTVDCKDVILSLKIILAMYNNNDDNITNINFITK